MTDKLHELDSVVIAKREADHYAAFEAGGIRLRQNGTPLDIWDMVEALRSNGLQVFVRSNREHVVDGFAFNGEFAGRFISGSFHDGHLRVVGL